MNTISFKLDSESKVKLHFQLFQKISELIENGEYPANTKLPSVRKTSENLSISRNTVLSSYKQLEEEGYVTSFPKKGYIVNTKINHLTKHNDLPDEEDIEIPTVDNILKQREGTEVQKIPLPKDFYPETVPINLNETQENKPSKNEQLSENINNSISIKQGEIDSFLENRKVNSKFIPIIEDLFGDKNLRKTLAFKLFSTRKISCTVAQVVICRSKNELIEKISNLLYPQINNRIQGRGLLKLAEAATKGELVKRKGVFAIDLNSNQINSKALESFENVVEQLGIETTIISSNDSGISTDYFNSLNCTTILTSPILWKEDKIPETTFTEKKSFSESNEDEEKMIDPRDTISDCREKILEWANEKVERYIIEYEERPFENNLIPALQFFDKSQKVIYIGSVTPEVSFAVLPSPLFKQYRELYKDKKCSVDFKKQTSIAKKISSESFTKVEGTLQMTL